MIEQQLKTGKAILDLIKVTEKALEDLDKWMVDSANKPSCGGEDYKQDSNYNLFISAYKDGSGESSLNLYRYYGNTALLGVIKAELEKQLAEFKADFAAL
jgi:hypothetical protein